MDDNTYILLLGDLYNVAVSGEDCPVALKRLMELDYNGVINVTGNVDDISKCQALICRPTSGGEVTKHLLDRAPTPFYIATFSKGTDHIAKEAFDNRNIEIIKGEGNESSVAELTIAFALSLLRSINIGTKNVREGLYDNSDFTGSLSLEGLKWGCLGAGKIPQELFKRLSNWGLSSFSVWHPEMSKDLLTKFIACTEFSEKQFSNDLSLNAKLGNEICLEINGINGQRPIMKKEDIISIHLPCIKEIRNNREPTFKMIDQTFINNTKQGVVILNTGRGDVIDEEVIVNGLISGKIRAYASDVLCNKAETTKNPQYSHLWSYVKTTPSDNIILTPHIGGTTKQSLEKITSSVINQLFDKLKIDIKSGSTP